MSEKSGQVRETGQGGEDGHQRGQGWAGEESLPAFQRRVWIPKPSAVDGAAPVLRAQNRLLPALPSRPHSITGNQYIFFWTSSRSFLILDESQIWQCNLIGYSKPLSYLNRIELNPLSILIIWLFWLSLWVTRLLQVDYYGETTRLFTHMVSESPNASNLKTDHEHKEYLEKMMGDIKSLSIVGN